LTTQAGTQSISCPPQIYDWVDPAYAVVQSSMVPCLENLTMALHGKGRAETNSKDNLKTLGLVFASYDSAKAGQSIKLPYTGGSK
jgi:D-apiose dehydrogenase